MPDAPLGDGSGAFDHLRESHATELVTTEGPRILFRGGYLAHIGSTHFR
jgi:hypothetical protein